MSVRQILTKYIISKDCAYETIFTQQPIFVKQHQARFNLVCDQASAETDRKTNKRKYILCDI